MGYVAQYVTDPREAVTVAMALQPAAVFLDIGMPHINGYKLLPMLREALHPRPLHAIALTAWGSAKDRQHSESAGFDHHLVKPVAVETLREVLTKLFG